MVEIVIGLYSTEIIRIGLDEFSGVVIGWLQKMS